MLHFLTQASLTTGSLIWASCSCLRGLPTHLFRSVRFFRWRAGLFDRWNFNTHQSIWFSNDRVSRPLGLLHLKCWIQIIGNLCQRWLRAMRFAQHDLATIIIDHLIEVHHLTGLIVLIRHQALLLLLVNDGWGFRLIFRAARLERLLTGDGWAAWLPWLRLVMHGAQKGLIPRRRIGNQVSRGHAIDRAQNDGLRLLLRHDEERLFVWFESWGGDGRFSCAFSLELILGSRFHSDNRTRSVILTILFLNL